MCFKLSTYDKQEAKIAKKNIPVWKAFSYTSTTGNTYITSYRDAHYRLGVIKSARLAKTANYEISIGLHSCITKTEATRHGGVICKAIIPKGSLYYKNRIQYVSNQLKIIKQVK